MRGVAFYISGHGFGHASRQIEIINALGPQLPGGCHILIRSAAAPWLFERTVRVPFTLLRGETDTGVVQIDSLHLDEEATAAAAARFYADWDRRVRHEASLLRELNARLIVVDAPPLGCAAGAATGIPACVCANFTWDWIFEAYPAFEREAPNVLPLIRKAYASARLAWRLPMHGGFATIGSILDVPFVARHARHAAARVRQALDLPLHRSLALVSFGGYGLDDIAWWRLDCLDEWCVVTTGRGGHEALPEGVRFVDESEIYAAGLRYEDLVAASDVVITKPGYGIVSECIANETAMLYTSRGHFVEYDAMIESMPQVLRCGYIGQPDLFAGRWRQALDAVRQQPPPPVRAATNGAEVIADAILRML